MINNNLQAALDYADKYHFSVIPLRLDKKPYIQWTPYQKKKATAAEIKQWWAKWPRAMIGIVTGEVSGIFVIDCDTQAGFDAIQNLLPDSLILPVARTPRGGWHLYFKWLADYKMTIGAGVLPGVDIRGEGGYVVAPPSVNAEGKAYTWEFPLDRVALPSLPSVLQNALINNSTNNIYEERYTCNADTAELFTYGRRDNDLFHTANCLIKGGMPESEISQVLKNLIISWGENPDDKWILEKIESAKKRNFKRETSITEAIEEWVSVTNGYFSVTDCFNALQSVTKSNPTTFRGTLLRLAKRGVIEKHGNKDGVYRKLNNEIEPLDWRNADIKPLDLAWPFDINELVNMYPGNIGIIAGSANAGKTAFLLNFIRLNQNKHKIHLFSSEGGKEELRQRISKFEYHLDSWNFSAWERAGDFADVIKPDDINIIDYLEIHDEFYKIGGIIKSISDRLKSGFALIALQKNYGRDEGLGGARGLEKPRLYLSMDHNRLKIVKAKSWFNGTKNPNGLGIDYKLVNGCKFIPESQWRKVN